MASGLSPAAPAALACALARPTPVLAAAAAAPRMRAAALLNGRDALVVVAPHPDDETLGAGCLLHDAHATGARCRVVCLTDGSASHPGSRAWGRERIARARAAELDDAVAILAPGAEVARLGWRDCGLPSGGVEAERAAERLGRLLPFGALVTVAWSRDPHVDHERAARLTGLAAAARPDLRRLEYPVWGRFDPDAEAAGVLVLDASAEARRAKRRALACHATQMTRLIDDDPDGFVMSPGHQAHFLDHPEVFVDP